MTDTVIDANQEITLKLNNEEAEIVKELLGDYAYAYRSDQEVDCKRELVRKEKIGKYPYFETAPDPELTNPYVDWTVPKWRSRDEGDNTKYEDLYKEIKTLKQENKDVKTENSSLKESVLLTNQSVIALGKQFNSFGAQISQSMKDVVKTVNSLADTKNTPTKATENAKEEGAE